MKRFLILLSILFCTTVFAHTIEWYVGDNLLSTTTCESGDNITPPTAPTKYGYHFKEWRVYKQQIEYLGNTGTQYIDTGVNAKNGLYIEIIFSFNDYSNQCVICARGLNDIRFWPAMVYNGHFEITIGPDRDNIGFRIQSKYKLYFDTSSSGWSAILKDEGNVVLTTASGNEVVDLNRNLFLFANNNYGSIQYPMNGKIYSVKIYSTNTIVRDFIPVLDFNDTPCMYDKVEGKFYYNAGTGQFIAGPAI